MRTAIGCAVLTAVIGAAHAAELDLSGCEYPEPPQVPDGASASAEEMGVAGAAVRDFVGAVESSLECLVAEEQSLGEEITDEQKATIAAIYNNGVDQMEAVAESYNEQVRLYKTR